MTHQRAGGDQAWRLVASGLGALIFWVLGVASLLDATVGTHLASVDRPRVSAAIWGAIGIIVALALTRSAVLRLRRLARPRI